MLKKPIGIGRDIITARHKRNSPTGKSFYDVGEPHQPSIIGYSQRLIPLVKMAGYRIP